MPVVIADGIVTRYVNYRENDRIISILTPDRGRIDAKARGCRRQNSALLPVCQPFVYGQFELFEGKDRLSVNQCEIKETFFPLREDYARFAAAAAALQLSHDASQENEPAEKLFSLLYHALSYLAYAENHPDDLMLCFLLRYLDVTGWRPSITSCARCNRDVRGDARLFFSARDGGAVCAACAASAEPVEKRTLEAMRRMLLLSDADMKKVVLPEELRAELTRILSGYVSERLEHGERALKTWTGA